MFLLAYRNESMYAITVSIYPIISNVSNQFIKKFQNVKGGFLI
jgi:hypothetical protein